MLNYLTKGMGKHRTYVLLMAFLILTGCPKPRELTTNPWLVPFQEKQTSTVSRSQMRAMAKLAHIYRDAGLEKEYVAAMVTAIDIYAGDQDVTFELLNYLIDKINGARSDLSSLRNRLTSLGVDARQLTNDNLPRENPDALRIATEYLATKDNLDAQYEECYRVLRSAAIQIPYNPDLYYRVASLQYIRAAEDGDRDKYKDAIYYLKRAIASDSGHLESYHLIALAYEKLNDRERAVRFWQLFEIIYDIAPQVMGQGFITPDRERLHREALQHLADLGAGPEE